MYKGDLASIPATDRRISNSEIVLGRYKTYSGHTIPRLCQKSRKDLGVTVSCRSNSWPISRHNLRIIWILIVCAVLRVTLSRVTAHQDNA